MEQQQSNSLIQQQPIIEDQQRNNLSSHEHRTLKKKTNPNTINIMYLTQLQKLKLPINSGNKFYSSDNSLIKTHISQTIRLCGQEKILYIHQCFQKDITYGQLFKHYPYCNYQWYKFPINQLKGNNMGEESIILEDSAGIHWVQQAKYIPNKDQKKPKNNGDKTLKDKDNNNKKYILNGLGITITPQQYIFEGIYHDSEKCGSGYQLYPDGNTYIGNYLHNHKHGQGVYHWFTTGQAYEGEWVRGLPHGQGIYRSPSKDIYHGYFMNGVKYGQGTQQFHNGDHYIGSYVNGMPEGYGEYYWNDNSYFKGDFKNGVRHGYGIWKSAKVNLNSGQQKSPQTIKDKKASNNKMSEQSYTGQYRMDKKQGFGVYEWINHGQIYKGQFKQDYRDGYGQLFNKEPTGQWKIIYKGGWLKGQQKSDLKIDNHIIEQYKRFIQNQPVQAIKQRVGHKNCIPHK